jgi:hypothetical protein
MVLGSWRGERTMPKRGHSEEQIVTVLRQAEAGEKVSEICCKVGWV